MAVRPALQMDHVGALGSFADQPRGWVWTHSASWPLPSPTSPGSSGGPTSGWPTDLSPKQPALVYAGIIPLARRLTEAFWSFLNLTAMLALIGCLAAPRWRAERLSGELTCIVVLPMLLLSLLHRLHRGATAHIP